MASCAGASARPRARALERHLTPPPPPPSLRSYNSVNGEPSCANDWLLKTLLRESWQFDVRARARASLASGVFRAQRVIHGRPPPVTPRRAT